MIGKKSGDIPDHGVSRQMTVGIVDSLENIDIDQQEAEVDSRPSPSVLHNS
jgi:hypothetical protein